MMVSRDKKINMPKKDKRLEKEIFQSTGVSKMKKILQARTIAQIGK